MRVLFVGDVVGRAGREAVEDLLPELVRHYDADYTIVNGENAAAGRGINQNIAESFFRLGVDAITLGNHAWDRQEALPYIKSDKRLLRAYNYPDGVPGRGHMVLQKGPLPPLAVGQLCGRVFMPPTDCPFRAAERLLEEVHAQGVIATLIDIHAEATSEKQALAHHLDGRASALLGTHTHVPTADETILPGGTAYVTDVGMTGAFASIIGFKIENILPRFLYGMPAKHEPASEDVRLCGVALHIDDRTGKALEIERILWTR